MPEATSLQIILSKLVAKIGFGFTVKVTLTGSPKHPLALTGTIVYITFTAAALVFEYVSSAILLAVTPFATAGLPATAVKPFILIAVIL